MIAWLCFSCKYCEYKSVDSTCFKRHMWRHQDKKPYKCTYCAFDGIQRSQIVAHMRSKHNVWPDEAKKLIKYVIVVVAGESKFDMFVWVRRLLPIT